MKILIATDGSEYSDTAIDKCADILLKPDETHVKILSVYERLRSMSGEPFGVSNEYYMQAEHASMKLADDAVSKAVENLRKHFPDAALDISTDVLPGSAARVIVETAEEWNADFIVMGSHGHGFWARNLMGSVSDAVVHHAPCSVFVVRPPLTV